MCDMQNRCFLMTLMDELILYMDFSVIIHKNSCAITLNI